MSKDVPSQVHNLIPLLQAGAAVAGILTGAYGLATGEIGKKYPVMVKVGIGATIAGLGFLLYREVLRQTKPEETKKAQSTKASIIGVRG